MIDADRRVRVEDEERAASRSAPGPARKRRAPVIATMAVALLALAAGALVAQRRDAADRIAASAAEMFYAQTLPDAVGDSHAMSAFRGRVVVVNFWATWCAPCVKEIPEFSKVHADSGGRVAFVGLGIDSGENIASFDGRVRPSYPLLVAGASGSDLARAFGDEAGALPFTVVLGPDGKVVASRLGTVDAATLKAWIAPFVDRPS